MKRGIFVALLIIVIIMVFLVLLGGFIYLQFNQEPDIPENVYLTIPVSGPLADSDDKALSKKLTIRDLFLQTRRAARDSRIKGVIFKISCIHAGYGTAQEIGSLIQSFRRSGKETLAYIECGGLKEYMIASYAEKVFVFAGDDLFLRGLASEAMFIKNTLDMLGITAEMYHLGAYKTAYNMFTEEGMTPEHRESLSTLLDDFHNSILVTVAANRNLTPEVIRQILDESPFDNQRYLDAGLIDDILYEDEILSHHEDEFKKVSLSTYSQTTRPRAFTGSDKIALVFADGEIHLGSSGNSSLFGRPILGSTTLSSYLRTLRKNDRVKAVVLRINSPGGSASASDVIRREVALLAEKKPLVVSMSDLAASGAYWISTPATRIIAHPQTITGSIGVISGKFVMRELYTKIGVKKEIIKTSPYSDMFTDYRLFSDREKSKLFQIMNTVYNRFVRLVASGRGLEIPQVEAVAAGRIWAGSRALSNRLVDDLGGLTAAIEEARLLAELPADHPVGLLIYPKKRSLLDMVSELLGIGATATTPVGEISASLARYRRFFPAAMLPYSIQID